MKVLLIDSNLDRAAEMRQALKNLSVVEMLSVDQAKYSLPPSGLDAVFLTLPAAERWNPNFKSREMQILRTSEQDRAIGFPPIIITGVNLTQDDPTDPLSQVRLILELTWQKVQDHNARNNEQVQRLGFWMMDLTREIALSQLVQLLFQIFSNASIGNKSD
jgi:hypothetical protein